MSDAEILALIKEALAEVAPNKKAQHANLTLANKIDDLMLDSVATMEMVAFVEDRLDRHFEDDQLARVKTLADLGKLISGVGIT